MKSPIVDALGRSTNEPQSLGRWLTRSVARQWKIWVALLSMALSGLSLWVSCRAEQRTATLAKMGAEPRFLIFADLAPSPADKRHFTLKNVGKVDALQVKVRMFSHRYQNATDTIVASVSSSEVNWFFPKIPTEDPINVTPTVNWLDNNSHPDTPGEKYVMELRIDYAREQDLKDYSQSAYFYLNPEGRWVGEGEVSLSPVTVAKLKSAVLQRKTDSIYSGWRGEPTYSNPTTK